MAFIDQARVWFLKGKKPKEQEFYQTFQWQRWKDELIGAADLTPELVSIINSIGSNVQELSLTADSSFIMTAKKRLVNVAVKNNSAVDMLIIVGTTEGGNELAEKQVVAGGNIDLDIGVTFWADVTIYIGGITDEVIVLIDRK